MREPETQTQLAIMGLIEEHLARGRLEGWYPDSRMYVDIFTLLCTDPKKAVVFPISMRMRY